MFLTSANIVFVPSSFIAVLMTLVLSGKSAFFLAALIYSAPNVAQIALQPLLAYWLKFVEPCRQATLLTATRLLSWPLSMLLIYLLPQDIQSAVGVFCIVIVLSSVDQVLAVQIPIVAKSDFSIPYGQSSAIGNMFGRGSMALAPIVAASFLAGDRTTAYVLPLAYLLGLFATIFLRRTSFVEQNSIHSQQDKALSNASSVRWSTWAVWYISFTFLVNITLASISFLILSMNGTSSTVPMYSVLYAVFLFVQLFISAGVISLKRISSPWVVCLLFFAISCLVSVYGLIGNTTLLLLATATIGVLYSITLPLVAEVVTEHLIGDRYLEYMASARSVGRAASLASTWLSAFILTSGLSFERVFLVSGAAGALAALLLSAYQTTLLKPARVQS
jgi:hypothetical protein